MSSQQQTVVETSRAPRRRRGDAKPSRKKVTLRPGIVLFDPKDLVASSADDWTSSLDVELVEDNQVDIEDDEEADNAEDNQEENIDVDPDSPEAKQARLRALVIEEICETEKSYVTDICTLNDHYIVALEDKTYRIMEDAQIAVFFNNLRHLVMLNSKLLEDLEEIRQRRAGETKTEAAPKSLSRTKSFKSVAEKRIGEATKGLTRT
ncbi:hypothetical protein F443_14587, partial [Phytophthora nicotianae P1569]